jgi:hypothetical protein
MSVIILRYSPECLEKLFDKSGKPLVRSTTGGQERMNKPHFSTIFAAFSYQTTPS